MIPERYRSWDYWRKEWIEPLAIALVLTAVIRTFLVQPFKIPSGSMIPTLMPGDRIFVSKLVYGPKVPFTSYRIRGMRTPETGDIVVFVSPTEKKYLVKRYIAGSGGTVEIRDGGVFVDGGRIESEPIKNFRYQNSGGYGAAGKAIKVPENCFFVLGDNSPNSMDSRFWGFVPERNLVGKAVVIHWPIRRIRFLGKGV